MADFYDAGIEGGVPFFTYPESVAIPLEGFEPRTTPYEPEKRCHDCSYWMPPASWVSSAPSEGDEEGECHVAGTARLPKWITGVGRTKANDGCDIGVTIWFA